MKPRLIIRQKITAFVNKYQVFTPNEDGTAGAMLWMDQQKRLAFKEKVVFYNDEKRDKLAFSFRAEKMMDVHGRYFVEDANGQVLGMFKKEFKASIVNSTWKILDRDGTERFVVRENNQMLALLRRFIGFIPIVGDFGDMIIAFFRYHFEFVDMQTSQVVGTYRKTTLFRDYYELAMTDGAWTANDWRVLAAVGVALDALQSR